VIASVGVASETKYRLYVPDNVADKVAKSWRGGNASASIADYLTEKDVRPTHLTGEAVHYLYPLAESDTEFEKHRETLIAAARGVTHLGWGVDMVVGNAAVIDEQVAGKLEREIWQPTTDGSGTPLRVPHAGTLTALVEKHAAFLNRLGPDGFRPVPPLTEFHTVGYRRATDPPARAWTAFRINAVDPDHSPPAFDTARWCRDVAGWVRHATAEVCLTGGWPFEEKHPIVSFVQGHDPTDSNRQLSGDGADNRFMYLPLPSVERRGNRGEYVGAIRRVLIAAPPGATGQVDWVRRRLPGRELVEEGTAEVRGMLGELQTSDWVLTRYTNEGQLWSTVTPVILPGYDDHDEAKAERLLRSAFRHAGLSAELADGCELEWRHVGFRAGLEPARRYRVPETLQRLPAYHVRVRFPSAIRGPLAIGAGRYRGFGLFVGESRASGGDGKPAPSQREQA
jgi:CRISPR-associated protein Csb2